MPTFGTNVNPAHYVEVADPLNAGQVKRPSAGQTLKARTWPGAVDLSDITTGDYGYWTATFASDAITVSGDGGTTWVGPLFSSESMAAASSAGVSAATALTQSATALSTAQQALAAAQQALDIALNANSYKAAVLQDSPVAFFALDGSAADLSGNGHTLTYPNGVGTSTAPNGELVALFNGSTQYAEIADAVDLSVPATGTLTVEAWIRPDTLEFPGAESSGDGPMVHFLGKGDTSNSSQEYAFRIYNQSASRPNRISCYVFNPAGGLGAGSYWQGGLAAQGGATPPILTAGAWVHVAAVFDTTTLVNGYGTTKIYRNGVLMDQDNMSDYAITPVGGASPLRVATQDLNSFFKGAIGMVAVYGHAVPTSRLAAHYSAMLA